MSEQPSSPAERDHLAALVASSDDAIVSKSLDGIVISWNRGAERLYGYSAAEMIGEPASRLIPPGCLDEEPSIMEEIRCGRAIPSYETLRLTRAGRRVPVAVTASAIRDAAGRLAGVSLIARDITERKRTHLESLRFTHDLEWRVAERTAELEELNRSLVEEVAVRKAAEDRLQVFAERLRLGTDAARIGIFEWDFRNDLSVWDGRMREIYGIPADEPISFATWTAAVLPEDLARAKAIGQRVIAGGGRSSDEYRIRRRDGATRHVHSAVGPITDAGGKVLRLVGVNVDVTELRENEEVLRLSEERFSNAFEHAAIGMALVSLDGHWLKVNRSLCDLLGYSDAEFKNKTFQDITHPEDLQADLDNVRQVLAGTLRSYHMEKRYLHREGRVVWALLSVSLVRDKENRPLYFISQIQDITATKEIIARQQDLLQRARAAEQAKSAFLAVMSHEIRTPMNGVIGMTDLLEDTELTEAQRDYVETIRVSGESLMIVINDILDLSKIESGKMTLEKHPLDLRQCVEKAVAPFLPKCREKGLRLDRHVDAAVPALILGDAVRLRQIVTNLVGNAVKFTERGKIVLAAEVQRPSPGAGHPWPWPSLHVSIVDTGIGISGEALPLLFNSFQQADSSTTRRYGGTGLGLAISKRLVELMDGAIWVESEEGKGSTFHFTVPLEEPPAAPSAPSAGARLPPFDHDLASRHPLRILLAEDNVLNQKVCAVMLAKFGYRSDLAVNGFEAVDAMRKTAYDLVLMDIQMPDLDGPDALRIVREQGCAGHPFIVALTANALAGDRERFLKIGFDEYLSKPLHAGRLGEMLRLVAGKKEGA